MAAEVEITKGLFGKYRASYSCPNCRERLRSPLTDAGRLDDCPNCHARFTVPGSDDLIRITEREKLIAQQKDVEAELRLQAKQRQKKERAAADALARKAERLRKEEEAIRERELREQTQKCPFCGAEMRADAECCIACKAVSRQRSNQLVVVGATVFAVIILIAAFYGFAWLRNSNLRNKLSECESSGIVNANVHYEGLISTDGVVFDVREGGSSSARRIDPVHLLMQFAAKLDLNSIKRVVLARNGKEIFFISASDLRPLADSYSGGGRPWSFNHLPESTRTMLGERIYSEWTGGWIGVLGKQTEDLNDLIRNWIES
jgi:hypothetical protein